MANRSALRLSAILLVVGLLLSLGVGLLHPGQEDPNNHPAVFAEYARSTQWTTIHLGQFAGMALILAGLLALFFALDVHSGTPAWLARLGAISTVVTLGLYGVLQAVDGVALKRAVDAWVNAPAAEKAARFASAEVVRWLEESVRSYQEIMLGLTFILFAIVIVQTARTPRPIGYLMGLSGILYIVQGWVVGLEGFSATHGAYQLPAYALILAWIVWLLVSAWKRNAAGKETTLGVTE
jgi:hypothetical protein